MIIKRAQFSFGSTARFGTFIMPILLATLTLGGCDHESEHSPDIRTVRCIVVEERDVEDPIVVTGHIRARDEVSLAFRLSGKLIERNLDLGDEVRAGQTVARLDDEIERNTLEEAEANLLAAQAVLEQSKASERRMNNLLKEDVASHDDYDIALRQLKTAQAQVTAAQARLQSAEDKLRFTHLVSDASGVITEKGAEPGEVVQAGQMILKVARQNGRDAIFDIPAQVIRDGLTLRQEVEVWLADSQSIKASGSVREISPQADPKTRNHQVKVELIDPPKGMLLGATVVGRLKLKSDPLIEIPSTALTMKEDKPAVWVIDGNLIRRREIKIERYTPNSIIVKEGLEPGERVVTAGVQELHEAQSVNVLGGAS